MDVLDPYPGRELLDLSEVRNIMGMERSTFARWLESDAAKMFPRPVVVGFTPKLKKPVLKYKKSLVMAFVELLPPAE